MYLMPSDMNVSDWSGLLTWVNYATEGWFGPLILITIFLILFITFIFVAEPKKAFSFSSFIIAILALLFRGLSLIGDVHLIVAFVMMGIGILMLRGSD